jgi:hypothetical protein
MAGVLRVPLGRFLLADAIYAIPLVNLLFWLSYLLTDQVLEIFNKINEYRPLVVVAVLSAIAGALIQKYILSRPVSTGEPPHVPNIIAKPAVAVGHAVERVVERMTGRHLEKIPEPPPDGAADQEFGIRIGEGVEVSPVRSAEGSDISASAVASTASPVPNAAACPMIAAEGVVPSALATNDGINTHPAVDGTAAATEPSWNHAIRPPSEPDPLNPAAQELGHDQTAIVPRQQATA